MHHGLPSNKYLPRTAARNEGSMSGQSPAAATEARLQASPSTRGLLSRKIIMPPSALANETKSRTSRHGCNDGIFHSPHEYTFALGTPLWKPFSNMPNAMGRSSGRPGLKPRLPKLVPFALLACPFRRAATVLSANYRLSFFG